jgi:serine/threonine-protein kinase ULK4
VAHPFWQAAIPSLALPPEPALDEFIRRYNLAPAPRPPGAPGGGADAGAAAAAALRESRAAARALRESVDVTRLSRIAMSNLEKVRAWLYVCACRGKGCALVVI